ncbi:hypothetical protein C8Q79DRAFT_139684 [Trametes meyenii]|nr:hypothetical protein C8Q79DRAFT_139684 [Trametes meyenii]
MSDLNDAGVYRDTPHNSFYPDSSQSPGRPTSGYPPSAGGRRVPRYSRATNASWVSNGMLSPPLQAGPPVAGSPPTRMSSPTPSHGLPGFHPQYPSPDELGQDPGYLAGSAEHRSPESYPGRGPPTSPGFYGGQGHEPEVWDPETEQMTIGGSVEENYHYGHYQGHQSPAAPEDVTRPPLERRENSFYDPMAPLEPPLEPTPVPKKKSTFVGGFIAGLRKLPTVMVRSYNHDRKLTRKGAPGTELPTGPSHYLPAYDEPGVTVADPASLQYVETGAPLSTSPQTLSPVSYANVSRPTSGTHAQRHSSQSAARSSLPSQGLPRISTARPVTPVLVSPLHPASDYAKMQSPVRPAQVDDSFSAHYTRIKQFLEELKALPWTSSPNVEDYYPAASSRALMRKTKQTGSWYTGVGPHQDVDLLGSARPAPRRLRSEEGGGSVRSGRGAGGGGASVRSGGARIAIAHDGRTPASFVTSPGLMPSPGMSSHGQGQHAVSYSYYFAPPQPLYVYPSPMATPLTNPPGSSGSSSSSSSPAAPRQEPGQAVPVYMVAGPPPGLLPSPPPQAHAPGHHREVIGSPSGPPPGLPVPNPLSASG